MALRSQIPSALAGRTQWEDTAGFTSAAMLQLLTSAALAANCPFTDSQRFERWSHFKDDGLPAVLRANDTLNQAAIADGSCRMLPGASYPGFAFWHSPRRVSRVLAALSATPSTSRPSNFTLTAQSLLAEACQPADGDGASNVSTIAARAAAMDNWHRALCAPAASPTWSPSGFDPA